MTDPADRIAQLEAEVAALRTALAALQPLPAAQQLLQQHLDAREQRLNQLRVGGDLVGGDKIGGNKIYGDQIIYQGGKERNTDLLLREYLLELSRVCRRLPLADLESSELGRSALDLGRVFTRLEVGGVAAPEGETAPLAAPPTPRHQTALEAVAANPRLVLLGGPGSGKSTLLKFVGLCMAQALLDTSNAPDWLAQLDGWPHGALLPIYAPLAEFATWVAQHGRKKRGGAALFWSYTNHRHGHILARRLREAFVQGHCIVLLDGLDEVPGKRVALLRRVHESIASLGAGSSRVLVSCRSLDYAQDERRQLVGWPTATLLPFSDQLRAAFIDAWYDALTALARPLNGDGQVLRQRLQAEVRGRAELRRLAGNPLLLTLMALLHAYEGRLPEDRVRLYEKAVGLLLYQWRTPPDEPPLSELLGIANWSESDVGRLLDRLGYAAHELGVSGDGEQGADLPRTVLIDTAQAFFAPYGSDSDLIRAQTFSNYITRYGNGVLQQHGPATYRFPHRTLQEYFAARRLVSDEWDGDNAEFVDRALRRIHAGPQWREPLLLAVSQLAIIGGQVRPAAQLADELLSRHPKGSVAAARDAILAGEVLAEVGRARLLRLGPRQAALWGAVSEALSQLLQHLDATGHPLLPVAERVRAGHALGALGDGRFPVTPDEWRAASDYWCEVPAGPVFIGSSADIEAAAPWEQPQHEVRLPPFRLARYPLTNAQWQQFMEAGGYEQQHWWSAAGWAERDAASWAGPQAWDDVQFNGRNQPVVGISWYEAEAFCRWLSAELGQQVYLPSEAEWEAAARGSDGRRYPWGERRAIGLANTVEGGVGSTTPVGCYPDGASPCGALDMAGNVWEWTATPWSDGYAQADGTGRGIGPDASAVIRGGVWARTLEHARCSARDGFAPAGRGKIIGVRVALERKEQ